MSRRAGRFRTSLLISLLLFLCTTAASAENERTQRTALRAGIAFHRAATWRWQDTAFVQRTRTSRAELHTRSIPYLRWIARQWNGRRLAARAYAAHPPHEAQWACIHRGEGAWNDPNSPYYGGLQMDLEFQATYGARLLRLKGTADHWTPLEQMWVAERAHRTRGFWPWPNTARDCGLL